MKPYIASLINAVVLIVFGLWGYLAAANPSFTALIPVVAGALLLALNSGIKREQKILSHIAVALTAILLVALIKPLTGAMGRDDMGATARVVVMMLATLWSLAVFVQSFIRNRG